MCVCVVQIRFQQIRAAEFRTNPRSESEWLTSTGRFKGHPGDHGDPDVGVLQTDQSLTVLLLAPRTVSAEAEGGGRGHGAQDGGQRGGFSSGDGVFLKLRLLLRSLLLQFEQSLQRQLLQVFAEIFGDGLKFVLLF